MRRSTVVQYLFGAVLTAGLGADASVIAPDIFILQNHPDGAKRPPKYGLRLDELFHATASHDVFTFDFDHPESNMRLQYDGASLRIFGSSFGGRDTGSSYAADQYLGIYVIDFLYSVGLTTAPGDTGGVVDLILTGNHSNFGWISAPNGLGLIGLADEAGSHPFTFRFGDTDTGAGYRGASGLNGWGWLNYCNAGNCQSTIRPHVYSSDWLFTATHTPEPGTWILTAIGLIAAGVVGRSSRQN